MDLYNREDLQDFLVSLFGQQAKGWNMNKEIFNLTHKLVAKSGMCSTAMNWVPRPMPIGATPYKYLSKELRSAFLRHLKQNKEQYVSCLRAAALGMATEFHLAGNGY